MELEHSFSVPVPVERAWDVLLDVARVAPCMPGATCDSITDNEITGKIKVKVGPITMTYAGTARFTEQDKEAGVVKLEASGKETRGAGTASASVRSELKPDGDQTRVTVYTTLNVTGKPAQFGRGVMNEVGGKLVGMFADNLAAMLAAEAATPVTPADETPEGNEAAAASGGSDDALPIDVLNLSGRAWSSLRQDGIQTLGDLTRRTEQQLLAIDNIGPASVADIRRKLADRGLALADSAEVTDLVPGKHAAAGEEVAEGEDLAEVMQLRPARHESAFAEEASQSVPAQRQQMQAARDETAAWQPPENDAIDLLDVAGLPVLKRALPALAGLIALVLVVVGVRRRRARRR